MKFLLSLFIFSLSISAYSVGYNEERLYCPADDVKITSDQKSGDVQISSSSKIIVYKNCESLFGNYTKMTWKINQYPSESVSNMACSLRVVGGEKTENRTDLRVKNGLFLISVKSVNKSKKGDWDTFYRIGENYLDEESKLYKCDSITK